MGLPGLKAPAKHRLGGLVLPAALHHHWILKRPLKCNEAVMAEQLPRVLVVQPSCKEIKQHDVTSISHLKLNICLRSPDIQRLCIRNIHWEFKIWVISYIFHSSRGNSRENRSAEEQFSIPARWGRKNCSGKILTGSQAENLAYEMVALIFCTIAAKPQFAV